MCEATLIMTGVSMVAQGYQAKQQGNYENDVAKYNARVTENEAKQVRNKGVEAENIKRQETAQLASQQRAQLGAAGVDIDSGSAADIQQDTHSLGEADARRIRSNFSLQANSLDTKASLIRADGLAKKKAGNSSFLTSIVGAGVGAVANKWL